MLFEHLAPHEREDARKMWDFRPQTCERCRQLAWEKCIITAMVLVRFFQLQIEKRS